MVIQLIEVYNCLLLKGLEMGYTRFQKMPCLQGFGLENDLVKVCAQIKCIRKMVKDLGKRVEYVVSLERLFGMRGLA